MASPTIEAAENIITKIKASVDDVFKFRDEFVVVHGLEAAGCRDQEVEGKMKEVLQQVEALAQHPDVRSGPALGRVLFERGRLLSIVPSQAATAEQDLGRASKFGVPGAWTLLGECLYNRGDLPAAATCFNRTLSMGEDKVALRNMSMLMRGLPAKSPEQREENINKGVEYARRAVKQDPGDGQSWMVLGNALLAAFFAGHANTTTLQACKAAYARAEHDKKASLLPELHLSKHQVAWYEEQYSAALASIKTACQLEPSWLDCQVKRQQCIKFLRTLVVMVAKTGHLSNKRLQTLIKSIRPNQLGPYEHSGTAISGNNKPDLVLFSQLVPNTNTDKIVQGMVVSTLVPESGIPFVMCLVDAEGTCLPVFVYNWAPGSEVKIGDAVAVLAPVLKEQTIPLESEETAAGEKPATAAKSSRERTLQGRKKLQNSESKKFVKNIAAKKVWKITGSAKSEKETGPEEELQSKEINEKKIDSVKNVEEEKLEKKEPDKSGDNTVSDTDQKKSEKSITLNENDRPLSNQNTSCLQGTDLDATAVNDGNIGMESAEQMETKQHNVCTSYTQDANQNQTGGSSIVENIKEENSVESSHEKTNGNVQESNTINNVEEIAMEDEVNKNVTSDSNISSETRDTLHEESNEPVSKMARTEAGAAEASEEIDATEKTEAAKARPQSKGGASSSRTRGTGLDKNVTRTLPRRIPASASSTSTTNSNNNNNNKNAMLNRPLTDEEPSSVGRKINSVNAAKSPVLRSSEKVQSSGSKPRATGLLKKQPAPGPASSRNSSTLPNTTSDTNKNVRTNVLPTRKSNVDKSLVSNSSSTKTPPKEATSSLSAKGSDAVPRVPESSSSNNTVKSDSKSNSTTKTSKSSGASEGVGTAKKAKPVLGRREAKTGSLAGDKQALGSSGRKPFTKTTSTTSVPSNKEKYCPSSTEKSGEVLLRSLRVVAPVMLVVNKRQVMAGQVAASYIVSQSKPE